MASEVTGGSEVVTLTAIEEKRCHGTQRTDSGAGRGPRSGTRRRLNESLPRVDCDGRGGSRSRARARLLHVRVCARLGVHDRRPAGLRELPRHERAIRRLDQEQPSLGRRVQRLSRAPRLVAKYATKASNGFWHSYHFTTRHVPRANPGAAGEPGHRGGELPPLPRARRRRRWGRPPTPDLATSRVSVVTDPWAIMELARDQRCRFAEVNRVRPETKRNARMESRCCPDRGGRDGSWYRGDRGTARQHHGAEGRSAEFVLPRRGAD